MGIIYVHDGLSQSRHLEQAEFGCGVGLHVGVIIQVIAAQVGKHGGVEQEARHAPLIERMG